MFIQLKLHNIAVAGDGSYLAAPEQTVKEAVPRSAGEKDDTGRNP